METLFGLLLTLFLLPAFAQTETPEVIVPLGDYCQLESMPDATPKSPSESNACSTSEVLPAKEKQNLEQLVKTLKTAQPEPISKECQWVADMGKLVGDQPIELNLKDKKERPWKIKFYFSNSKTYYQKTTAKIKNSRMDLTIRNLKPEERRSGHYYAVWNAKNLQDAFRWIDEPTNTFQFSVEHKKDDYFVRVFHPKLFFVTGDQDQNGDHYNEDVDVQGTLDGKTVNRTMGLHRNAPDNLHMDHWEDSHKFTQIEGGYGHTFVLAKAKGKPILVYEPSVMAGVYVGIRNSGWDNGQGLTSFDDDGNSNGHMKVMGVSVSTANKVTLHNRNDNVGLFVEHKFSYGKMNYDLFDGTVQHNLIYNSLSVGVQITLIKAGKKQ